MTSPSLKSQVQLKEIQTLKSSQAHKQSPNLQTISLFLIYIESPCILRARINSKFRIHRLVPIDYDPSYFISGEFNCHHHHSRATSARVQLGQFKNAEIWN